MQAVVALLGIEAAFGDSDADPSWDRYRALHTLLVGAPARLADEGGLKPSARK